MKKNIHTFLNVVLVVLIILCILIPSVFTAAEMGVFTEDPVVTTKVKVTDKDAPVLKIATDYDFSPNSYYNTNGDLSGLYIEIMIEAANRIGMRPDFKTGEWQECRQMLEDGPSTYYWVWKYFPICRIHCRRYQSVRMTYVFMEKRR
ncbi:MAG: transporter substrate-binding domain-containing protein [Dorea sp.]